MSHTQTITAEPEKFTKTYTEFEAGPVAFKLREQHTESVAGKAKVCLAV